jgi:uncharacterized protein
MKPFTLLIKPASADCNLCCQYCFYLDHGAFYPSEQRHRMSDTVLSRLIQTYMATPQPQYTFGWQGGEPTLMGADFFRRAVELQMKYGRSGASVGNGVQTNGVLIDDEMAALFARYHFLLGVSLDGPPALHDRYRLTGGGNGSHHLVMRGIEKLREHGVEFNILTLVSAANVGEGAAVYRYLTDNGFLFHQYIPCVEVDANRGLLPFSISGEQWGEFMCTVFDQWYAHDTRRVSVRLFDAIVSLLVNGRRDVCHFGRDCCQYFVVEYNGDVFPCDFFVEKRLHLGNIMHDAWSALQASPMYAAFGRQKALCHPLCAACEFADICVGDCLKHRFCGNGGDPARLSHLCSGWKMFFSHTLDRFRELAAGIQEEQRHRSRQAPPRVAAGAVGRNDLCPCGSGRKYKKCCGA